MSLFLDGFTNGNGTVRVYIRRDDQVVTIVFNSEILFKTKAPALYARYKKMISGE